MRSEWLQVHFQESLEAQLHKIFPLHNIHSNTRKKTAVTNADSGRYLEVDMWVPELKLCFEFQDHYHYKPAGYSQIPLDFIQQRDNKKRFSLMNTLQTLIAIPCWWDGSIASLRTTIHFQRPDLQLLDEDYEIPTNPPLNFFPDTHPLMLASFADLDVIENASWWVGEKWDGIRCIWDASEKQLYSRNKLEIDLQSLGDDLLGNIVLDAELWCGRRFFNESQTIAFTFVNSADISFVRLLCFDEASLQINSQPFENRYSLVLANTPQDHPTILNAPRFLCENETVLLETLHGVTGGGGEGVMLRQPFSAYLPGQSDSLFKMKASYMHRDQEALVQKVEPDGSLVLQMANGKFFSVEKNNCILPQRVTKGDIVTFKVDFSAPMWYRPYQKSNAKDIFSDVLANAVVYRIRSDLAWEEVVQNSASQSVSNFPIENSVSETSTTERGTWQLIRERKAFFDRFAASKGMDPLNPTFWYTVKRQDLMKHDRVFKYISTQYSGDTYAHKLYAMLTQLYPDIGIQWSKFTVNDTSRRKFFDNFAAAKGMDSLNPIFWHTVKPLDVLIYDKDFLRSGIYNKLPETLMRLYPNIGLQHNRFAITAPVRAQRRFFDKYAASKGMDPLNPVFWYNVPPNAILKHEGYLKGKLSAILAKLYPDIGLQQSQFKVSNQSWTLESARKQFFDTFAKEKGKDPLNPSFWYTVTPQQLLKYNKSYPSIAMYYGRSLASALMELYPGIGLQKSQFRVKVGNWRRRKRVENVVL